MHSENTRAWMREHLPDYAEAIFRAEDAETWVLDSEEFERSLYILHRNLCRHRHSLDEHSVSRLKVVLVFTRFSFFLHILRDLQYKNEEILIRILRGFLPERSLRDAVDNAVAVRMRYLVALGVCRRVFSEERINRVILALSRRRS